jgi:hypothetical protein
MDRNIGILQKREKQRPPGEDRSRMAERQQRG